MKEFSLASVAGLRGVRATLQGDDCTHLHRENSKPYWQRYNSLCLARGRLKLFTNEKVKIKYPDVKNKVFFSLCQLPRVIPDCFIQHFVKCPIIVFRWKIFISPLCFILPSLGRLYRHCRRKRIEGLAFHIMKFLWQTVFFFGVQYNLVTPFIPLRHIKKLCQKKKPKSLG